MGVNFPEIRYIIIWGAARSILDLHQEAGRAGRDGLVSHVIVLYHGQQIGPSEQEVKDFVRAQGCLRVAAYKSLDSKIGNCEEELPKKPVGRLSVNCRPSVDRQVTNGLPTANQQVTDRLRKKKNCGEHEQLT